MRRSGWCSLEVTCSLRRRPRLYRRLAPGRGCGSAQDASAAKALPPTEPCYASCCGRIRASRGCLRNLAGACARRRGDGPVRGRELGSTGRTMVFRLPPAALVVGIVGVRGNPAHRIWRWPPRHSNSSSGVGAKARRARTAWLIGRLMGCRWWVTSRRLGVDHDGSHDHDPGRMMPARASCISEIRSGATRAQVTRCRA
jgi:hypothetical protein